jgi:hypothetical protein
VLSCHKLHVTNSASILLRKGYFISREDVGREGEGKEETKSSGNTSHHSLLE